MEYYCLLKWVHILSAMFMVGTGFGSAFYKFCADRNGNIQNIYCTNRIVVLADWIFTTPAVIIQPITGVLLAQWFGFSFVAPWLILAIILYVIAGLCWIPAVWLQIRMRDLSCDAMRGERGLDNTYYHYARIWFWLGVPAFGAMLIIYYLMVFKVLCPW